ncbi:hypothetical protein [Ornithinimicrobium cryptoxanthini]|uniref:Uncharacterized protein n=1 Tax=Ornithinimicrobium cryptoxanthini TaxID=2934161 RepID=A0ABY4YFQ6_9MICO|nr:hypothetical protein [Ornithinimicrobium cryptoxanthini]USQ75611.1 hypothetical protein NF557_13465 [Ornithinimicrobium cryptoxanthini]
MGENELLLRHTETWASAKNRPLDRDLLETAIRLWTGHGGHAAQEWPAGSAESLLLQQWPTQAHLTDAEVGALVESLETFWRFLRATGRMRSGSAEPRALTKEARRAAPKMIAAAAGPEQHRPMTVEEALVEWPGDVAEWEDEEEFEFEDEFEDEFAEDYFDDFTRETWALLPDDHDGWASDPPVEVSAWEARKSPLVQECLRFARWIGDGKRITGGVLRPAQVREASAEFDLGDWEREFLARSPHAVPGILDSPAFGDRASDGRLGGIDHLVTTRALQTLWFACTYAGLIEVESTVVRATPDADPQHERSPDDWARLGHVSAVLGVVTRHFLEPLDPVLRVLLPFLREGVDRVEVSEVQDWWWEHDKNPWTYQGLGISQARTASDHQVERLLWAVGDTGIWRRERQTLHRTALGMDVAMDFVNDLSGLLATG